MRPDSNRKLTVARLGAVPRGVSVLITVAALDVLDVARLLTLFGHMTLLTAVAASTRTTVGIVRAVFGEVAHWNSCQYMLESMAEI